MDMDTVIMAAERRLGSARLAERWYRSKSLPGFGGRTAKQWVGAGHAAWVIGYFAAVDAGIHV